jgi:hypothetical protein
MKEELEKRLDTLDDRIAKWARKHDKDHKEMWTAIHEIAELANEVPWLENRLVEVEWELEAQELCHLAGDCNECPIPVGKRLPVWCRTHAGVETA